jgi:enediyne biosynthesis protein E4
MLISCTGKEILNMQVSDRKRCVQLSGGLVLALVLCAIHAAAQQRFTDVTEASRIRHQFVVYEGMFGGGACVFDFNQDGYEDLFITGGMNDDVLYMNMKDGTFSNVFAGSGLEVTTRFVTQGAASADFNRDGWPDLLVTTITKRDTTRIIPRAVNLLFINNGDNTFRDATTEYGLDQLMSFSTGVCAGDVNNDGYADLYVGNYFAGYEGALSEINDATIVNASQTAKGYLLINQNGQRFRERYEASGLRHKGFGFGGVFTDFDNDGDVDLFINHDFGYKTTSNILARNNGRGAFDDVSNASAMDLKINAMGTAIGDYNNDGWLDYYITNIRFNRFMVSEGQSHRFVDRSAELGMDFVSISWGANFGDFDHDGDVDLFVANGDLNPNDVPLSNFYFQNDEGKFRDRAHEIGLNDYGVGRGSVMFDMDNDGDLDLLVVNQRPVLDYPVSSVTRLYRNDMAAGNWLKVKLRGIKSEHDGIGARVRVVAGGMRMIREVEAGSSHLSQNTMLAHFGLGTAVIIDSVIVTWPGGYRQFLFDQPVNQLLVITEPERNDHAEFSAADLIFLSLAFLTLGVILVRRFARKKVNVMPR